MTLEKSGVYLSMDRVDWRASGKPCVNTTKYPARKTGRFARTLLLNAGPASGSRLSGQINNFPEGQLVVLLDEKVVGYCTTFLNLSIQSVPLPLIDIKHRHKVPKHYTAKGHRPGQ